MLSKYIYCTRHQYKHYRPDPEAWNHVIHADCVALINQSLWSFRISHWTFSRIPITAENFGISVFVNICLAVFSFYLFLFSKHFFILSCPEYRLCSFSFLGPHGVGVPLFSRLSLFHFALANAPLSSLWIFPVFCLWPWLSVYLSFPHLPTLCPPRTHNHTNSNLKKQWQRIKR